MAHRFLVVGPDPRDKVGRASVYYVTDEEVYHVENIDPRESERTKDRIVHEDVIEVGAPREGHVSWEEYPAILAIASIDNARPGQRPRFRMALVKVYEMGMRAQRELDKKTATESARKEHEFLREAGEPHFPG